MLNVAAFSAWLARKPGGWGLALEYGFAVLLVALASVARFLLDPHMGDAVPYVMYFLSNAIVIGFTGLGPSILAIVLSTLAADYFFLPPRYSFGISPAQGVTSGVFVLANFVILALAHSMRAAKIQAEADAASLRKAKEDSEQQLAERQQAEEALTDAREDLRHHAEDLEKVVAARTAKLQELVGELEHFSYTLSHDLRSPLRAMRGFSDLMLQSGCAACNNCTSIDFLQRILAGAERMEMLINDALDYNRAMHKELPLAPVDVAGLLRGMLQSYPNFLPMHADISLEGEFPLVFGHEGALTQCFSNLLGNAVKFVAPGVKPRIRIWAEEIETPNPNHQPSTINHQLVRIWIEDNGIGIAPEDQNKLFGIFERVNTDYEGTGIGLALVHKNMEKMGGKVGVESEPGKGSRFWIELNSAEQVLTEQYFLPLKPAGAGIACPQSA